MHFSSTDRQELQEDVVSAAFSNPKLEHLALRMIAQADADGVCKASVDELAAAVGVGARQLANLRRELACRGFTVQQQKGDGRGVMSRWRMLTRTERNAAMQGFGNAAILQPVRTTESLAYWTAPPKDLNSQQPEALKPEVLAAAINTQEARA